MPSDAAIPKPEIPAPPRFTRAFVLDRQLLQRERKESIPGGLWTGACIFILLCALGACPGGGAGGGGARRGGAAAPRRGAGGGGGRGWAPAHGRPRRSHRP